MSANQTIEYYNNNAESFIKNTLTADLSTNQEWFLRLLPQSAAILDFGCGSGRDAICFLNKGYLVDAVDGSAELCRLASQNTGLNVRRMLFSDLNEVEQYDGIWACASLLHVPSAELKDVIYKMLRALKRSGFIYASFKYGEYEGFRNGRYFTDFTEESFRTYIADITELVINELWLTDDVRPGRGDEKWLNLILQKADTY